MHKAPSIIVALALCLAYIPTMVCASDWEEDESSVSHFSQPPRPTKLPKNNQSRLEGNVSKYGSGAYSNSLYGPPIENAQSSPARPSYLSGSAYSFLPNAMPFIPPKAQSIPPSMFRGWLEKTHPDFALSTNTLHKTLVLEVRGKWDDSSRTMRSLGIPHTNIRPGKLKDYPFEGAKVLVVNCAGKVPQESLQHIRNFVARGGYLLTTDWALDGLVRRAFPGYIEWNGGHTEGIVVDATLVDSDPLLLAGTVLQAGWKLDEASQTVRILNRPAVRVLAVSSKLRLSGTDPDGQGILAVTFAFGRGQVLHLVGHFDNNANLAFANSLPDPAPGIGISLRQALAANFLVAALTHNRPSSNSYPDRRPAY
ncbi:MAG: hypothetical protein HY711_08800 [Candidatus Melainabacteria bacterium]|nr:hypothetical protein [Candidatus Melainabacteria bacterium]